MTQHFTCDTHADTLMRMIDLGYDIDDPRLQVSAEKMLSGGHDLQIFACFIDPVVGRNRFISRTLQMIDLLKRSIAKKGDKFSLCTSSVEIGKARSQDRKIAMLGIEGGHAIENDLSVLRCYRELGVIYMTLTWSNTNDWADSSNDVEKWGGLTDFGREVVREMNRINMVVDVSHVSDKTFWHTLEISTKPVIASHSSVRAICNHPRNMTDEMIRAMADAGGVMFINFFPSFISQEFNDAYKSLSKKMETRVNKIIKDWEERNKPEMYTYDEENLLRESSAELPAVRLEDVIRHVEHAVKIAGIESVGFGSDFDGVPFIPSGLEDCTRYPVLCDELKKRGFSSADVDKLAGQNFVRVFRDIVG